MGVGGRHGIDSLQGCPSELSPTRDWGHPALESALVTLGTVGTGRPGGGLRRAGRTGRVETGGHRRDRGRACGRARLREAGAAPVASAGTLSSPGVS